jgi:predicted lipoprotein with Yx(FWY)xxD motif
MKTIKFTCLILPVMLALGSIFIQSCSNEDHLIPDPTFDISLKNDITLGNVLTDGTGNSLYFFEKDVEGKSLCSGGCTNVWPIFFSENIKSAPGIEASLFGTITREDGKKQTTYKGWPLYRFAQDVKAGDVKGDNKNGFFAAKPDYSVFFGNKGAGRYLVDAFGKTLYTFVNDQDDISNCKDGCAAVWPAFFVEPPVVPSSLKTGDFYKITRIDLKQQVTFAKKPVYFFSKDLVRGDVKGTDANAKFTVLSF